MIPPISKKMWLKDPFIIRNLTYGIEDSLVSTAGVVVGVASAGFSIPAIIATSSILILVEASSMSFGAFISDANFLKASNTKYTTLQVLGYAAVMFLSYTLAGLLTIVPFIFKLENAVHYSVALAMIALFILIIVSQRDLAKALLLTTIGGAIMLASIYAGKAFAIK
jgi:hypothetical protein